MKNPMLDQFFLTKLDLTKDKQLYAKIILLNKNEEPIEEIQGRITAGSINIDGASAVRSTCSLTLISEKIDINNTYWTLNNKFRLEIGVQNKIDKQYPDIIWFNYGIFIFTSLNMNVQTSNYTISLNGKDKMCLLNGEVGGSINASTDFGKLEEYTTLDNGEIVRNIIDIPIKDIIKNIVHTYGGEPLHNIIINDLENYGLELLEYRGDRDLYMPRGCLSGQVSGLIINPAQTYYLKDGSPVYVDNTKNQEAGRKEIIYYDRTELSNAIATKVWTTPGSHDNIDEAYNIIKISFGETAGYRRTELTYPGELVANVGESVVSVLDKIKNMFGDFEYFYDSDGRFVFQKKKTYINTSFNNIKENGEDTYVENAAYTSSTIYSFENGTLLSAFTNAPQILNIKNDFSIWGKRKGVSGMELPIHTRYAIDVKPTYYKPLRFIYEVAKVDKNTYKPNTYYIISEVLNRYELSTSSTYDEKQTYYCETDVQDLSVEAFKNKDYDWREIIYQMALDYFKYNHKKDDFTQLIAAANPDHYPTGVTGYETYYTDIQGFWRELYHPGVIGDESYELFTRKELFEAAREVILQEREFIEKEDIAQLIIDYIYNNFDNIRNYFINQIDFAHEIEQRIQEGLDASSLVIQELLEHRWEKMGREDKYDYDELMEQYLENGGNKEDAKYKTLQILKDFRDKQYMKDTNYAELIEQNIEAGFDVNSYTIQELLAARWRKMGGEDKYDYETLKQECINNGYSVSSAKYQTLIILDEYKTTMAKVGNDIAEFIKNTYIAKNIVDDNTMAIKDLLILRWTKMGYKDNYNYDVLLQEEWDKNGNSDQYKLLLLLQAFKNEQENLDKDIASVIEQYIESGFTENSTIIQDLLARRWRKMGGEDIYNYSNLMEQYLENGGNKEDAKYKTLQILNNYKIQQLAKAGKYGQINFMDEIEARIKQGYSEDSYEIQELLVARWEDMNRVDSNDYLGEMEREYIKNGESARYQALVIAYNFKNAQKQIYIDKEQVFISETEPNKFQIVDPYLDFLYISREKKIDSFGPDEKVISNEKLIWVIVQVIKTLDWSKSVFKQQVTTMMDQQINKDAYDFAQELIDYIYDNYDVRESFFTKSDDEKISVKHPHIKYLLEMRQEKIYELANDPAYIENDAFIKIIYEIIDTTSLAKDFKTKLEAKLKEVNTTLSTDYSQQIIDLIYNNYDKIVEFDETSKHVTKPIEKDQTNGEIKIHNSELQDLLDDRKEKIETYTNFQIFIDNKTFLEQLVEAIEEGYKDKEKYKKAIQIKLKFAITTKKNLNATTTILVQAAGNGLTEVSDTQILEKLEGGKTSVINYFKENYNDDGWNKNIKEAPYKLNFWFDFMNTEGEMGKYSIKAIGNRPKAVNDDKITAIYFQEVPSVLFITPEQYEQLLDKTNREDYNDMTGYTFIKLQPFMESYFTISAQGKSAQDQLNTLLYQHTYATESVTLTAVPIYHLYPNARVFVKDDNTGINGEYIISKITIPLQYNGTSSITTTKAVERIY